MYVFKIGPVPGERGDVSVVVALDEEHMAPPASGASDRAALRSLQRKLPGAALTCDPALAEAAAELGLATAPVPDWVLPVRAAMALGLAMGPFGEAYQDVETMIDLVEAATAFVGATPWRRVGPTEPVHVTTTGALPRAFEAQVLGEAPGDAALVLFEGEGEVARVGVRRPEDVEHASALALRIEPAPDFLATVGLAILPLPMRIEGGLATAVEPAELLALLASARSIAALAGESAGEGKATVELGGEKVTARASLGPKKAAPRARRPAASAPRRRAKK